jgi:signal transduction histidine kinase
MTTPDPACSARAPLTSFDDHPLEIFPWARRIPQSPLRDLAYTLVFNTLIAATFTVLSLVFNAPARSWGAIAWSNFVVSNCIGFVIHAEFVLAERLTGARYRTWTFAQRAVFFSALPIAGVIVGYWIAFELLDWERARRAVFSPAGIVGVVALSILISSILAVILSAREKAARAQAAYEAERARVATAERATALAQLKALEAQVEPHFLYNTLAHVTSLIDMDPGTARRMLERLIVLLRASAGGAPDGRSTLGEQLAHMRAYLELVAMRLGPRLAWSIDAPQALAARALPPAILQPLVENAVKHGIEPSVNGGSIAIAAREDDGRIVVEVADTGVGIGAATAPLGGSTGIGLANLRARLAALYGADARVTITENAPTGMRVTVALPAGEGHA